MERDVDLVLKNLKLEILGQPYHEVLLTTHTQFKHYRANDDYIILKEGFILRKYYGVADNIKCFQILVPKQLFDEIFWSLHGEFGKYPGIAKTKIAYRQKYYYPNMAQLIRQGVMSCERCFRESRVDDRLTRPAL